MWDGLQSFPRGHDLVVGIGLADLAFGVDAVDGKVTGAAEVELRIEHITIEAIDGGGVFLRDVAIADNCAEEICALCYPLHHENLSRSLS